MKSSSQGSLRFRLGSFDEVLCASSFSDNEIFDDCFVEEYLAKPNPASGQQDILAHCPVADIVLEIPRSGLRRGTLSTRSRHQTMSASGKWSGHFAKLDLI